MRSSSIIVICFLLSLTFAAPPLFAQEKQPPAGESPVAAKLDEGLDDDPDARYPIFVRMKDQLFRRGGDYERFAEQHAGDKRSELRKLVLKTLREKSEASWAKVADRVKQLEEDGEIRGRERYWIVNGFACAAGGRACGALAELDEVEFVYMQKGNARQHRTGAQPAERGTSPKASPKADRSPSPRTSPA